jgi:hypothetical protein
MGIHTHELSLNYSHSNSRAAAVTVAVVGREDNCVALETGVSREHGGFPDGLQRANRSGLLGRMLG